MKKVLKILLSTLLLFSINCVAQIDSKDLLLVYSKEYNYMELVDGFIFKIQDINKASNKLEVSYLVLVREKTKNEYYLTSLQWQEKLEAFKGVLESKFKVLDFSVNTFSANKLKCTFNKKLPIDPPIMYFNFSNDKVVVEADGKKQEIKGKLKSLNDVKFEKAKYGVSLLDN
ncbi:hypothetical protein RBH94_15080 [Aestuariibaculum sp. YM273]|uniref:hypothetical protein n=1 Tax=Aestuariibaculum sp. YM273 TaxID=3070659 RepID=UPI0027DB2B4A|nr:hypothetical protein [Aestuariibaculum sp. YM273]WMI65374.1 hypothetical protein RBH94_15080 [Aestuariibaculum sp. YM273]